MPMPSITATDRDFQGYRSGEPAINLPGSVRLAVLVLANVEKSVE